MHIVHIVRQFHPAVGGLENVVWELASMQVRDGHDVRVVTLNRVFDSQRRDRLAAYQVIGGIEIIRVPYVGSSRYPIAPSVIRHLGDADIVHVHGLDFLFDYLALTVSLHRRRLVASTHGAYFHTPFAALLKRLYFPTVTRFSLSRYAGVATVSVADDRLFRGIRSRGISLIENGVNIDKYADAAARVPSKRMIAVGRFSSNKRLDRVISFMAALRRRDPEWRLTITGRPWDVSADDLMGFAQRCGADDAIEVVASPSDDEIRAMMGRCSIIVSASDYEGFGLAAVEGMSAGLFPLLSPILPFQHLVERTQAGMVVDFSDAEAAAERFLACWPQIAGRWDDWRRTSIAASGDYSWSRVSRKYEQLYHGALGTKVRSILDVAVGVTTFPEAVDLLDARFHDGHPAMVVFANAHTLNMMRSNGRVRDALQKSIVFNDGIGIDLASRLLFGKWFPANLNGTDFVPDYLKATRNRYRIFLLGAKPGIAASAAKHLMSVAPHHRIVGSSHGYLTPRDADGIVGEIRRSQADVLLVAMGNPEQELWLMERLDQTGCQLGFGVGALFDFMAGAVPRAPGWMQTARLEWLYRMVHEPRRLWRRYLVGMPMFLLRVAGQWVTGARVSGATRDQ
jgi:alpha-1,3-mannosyltransferase